MKPMSSGITSKKRSNGTKTHYYYYRCETDGCTSKNKSIRAKVIVEFAINILKQYLFTTKSNYAHHIEDAKEGVANMRTEYNSVIGQLNKQVSDKKMEYYRAKEYKIKDPNGLGKHYDLDEIKSDLDNLEKDRKTTIKQRAYP
jgi:hypothetical protein